MDLTRASTVASIMSLLRFCILLCCCVNLTFLLHLNVLFFLWQQPDGILKMKKLKKVVLKALQESGIVVDETELSEALHQKVSPSI